MEVFLHSSAYVWIARVGVRTFQARRTKLDNKAEKLILVGCAEGREVCRLLNPENCSRGVKFDDLGVERNMRNKEKSVRIQLSGPEIDDEQKSEVELEIEPNDDDDELQGGLSG